MRPRPGPSALSRDGVGLPYLHLSCSLSVALDVRPSLGLREAVHGVFFPSCLLLKGEAGLDGHRDRNKTHR